ncbi:MAG: hypothetical protein KIT34_16780 [Cyanobacteria bacterium TGS_CYA1]|nr:hypothetical protein [Cyanobacteria bacterium TGS_CYA1]
MIPKEEPYLNLWEEMPCSNEVEQFEARLAGEPFNFELRAGLMTRYHISREKYPQFEEPLLKHILWFVEQVPDWKLCGTHNFALRQTDFGYAKMKDVWERKILESDNVMRRVNYYLFEYYYENRHLPELFERLFDGKEENIWVKAIKQINVCDQDLFTDLIAEEGCKPIATNKQIEKYSAIDGDELVKLMFDDNITFKNYEKFKNTFHLNVTTQKLACVLGYTWNRQLHFSQLLHDPEIIESQTKVAAWFIRNRPDICGNAMHFIMFPFLMSDSGRSGVRLEPLITLLTDLWLQQVDRFPDNLIIARNAVKLCRRIHITSPDDHKRIMKHVGKTAVGKRALRLERY